MISLLNKLLEKEKVFLLVIFLLAIILRIGLNIVKEEIVFNKDFFYFGENYSKNYECDSLWYHWAAKGFLEGKGVVSMNLKGIPSSEMPNFIEIKQQEDGFYAHKVIPPFYPLVLSLFYAIFGFNTLAFFLPQIFMGSITCVLIYYLTKSIFDKTIAATSAIIVLFYPDLIFWTYQVRVETLFILLLVLGFLLLTNGNLKGNTNLILLSSVLFGLASLTRITFMPFVPILIIWQIIYLKIKMQSKYIVAMLMLLIIILVLLPWCIRNYNLFGKFTVWTDEVNTLFIREDARNYNETSKYFIKHKSFTVRLLIYMRNNINEYSKASVKRFFVFWGPFRDTNKPFAKIYKSITWILVFPLAWFGMIRAIINKKKVGLIIVFIMYYSFIHAGSFIDCGIVYRYPIQPFLCIFTAYGFYQLLELIKSRNGAVV